MAPRDQSPRASDHRRPYDNRRDMREPRDTRDHRGDHRDNRGPRRDRSTSRDRNTRNPRRANYSDRPDTHRDQRTQNRSRSPARGPRHDGTRQRSPTRNAPGGRGGAPPREDRGRKVKTETAAPPPEDEDEEAAMKRLMGFSGFRSTKNTKVPGNDKLYGVRKDKQTQYRQYMNRVGGFNRPLSPTRM